MVELMKEDDPVFDVLEEQEVQDLTDVKEQRFCIPRTAGVKVRIDKVEVQESRVDNRGAKDDSNPITLKGLKLQVRIVDGIEQPVLNKETGEPTGETEMKWINMPLFTGSVIDLCFYANKTHKTKPYFQNNQHLVRFKQLCQALDLDLTSIKINDEFITELIGKEVLVDIGQEPIQEKSAEGGYVDTAVFKNKIGNWKKSESLI